VPPSAGSSQWILRLAKEPGEQAGRRYQQHARPAI